MTTTKHAQWLLYKEQCRQERKQRRGVTTTIAEVREKHPCTCGHTKKHHKKTGRCRGKMPTNRIADGHGVARTYRVPAHLLGLPSSCDCKAGMR